MTRTSKKVRKRRQDAGTHPLVARPLVAPPEDYGMAERGLLNSIGLRIGQLLALARTTVSEQQALEVLNRTTDPARDPRIAPAAGRSPIPDPFQVIAGAGAVLGDRIRESLVTYAREYDAEDSDTRVHEDARIFRIALARQLLAGLEPEATSRTAPPPHRRMLEGDDGGGRS
jgi:hypothetical protein